MVGVGAHAIKIGGLVENFEISFVSIIENSDSLNEIRARTAKG